jgi:hypothetical protein
MTVSQLWVRLAGTFAGLTVVAIGLVNGLAQWDAPSSVSLWLLAIAVAFVFWAPSLFQPSPESDATRIAMIGPVLFEALVLIVLSGLALFWARNDGSPRAVWTLDVLYAAVLFVGTALLKASVPLVESAASASRRVPQPPPTMTDDNW